MNSEKNVADSIATFYCSKYETWGLPHSGGGMKQLIILFYMMVYKEYEIS